MPPGASPPYYKCSSCGHAIAANAEKCSGCGTYGPIARHPNSWQTTEADFIAQHSAPTSRKQLSRRERWVIGAAVVFGALVVIGALSPPPDQKQTVTQPEPEATATPYVPYVRSPEDMVLYNKCIGIFDTILKARANGETKEQFQLSLSLAGGTPSAQATGKDFVDAAYSMSTDEVDSMPSIVCYTWVDRTHGKGIP